MPEDYRPMWRKLGLDLEKHDKLLEILNEFYPAVYLQQDKRPAAMEYFDFVISEIHGLRIKELLEHKAAGGKVVGTFCLYVPDELLTALGAVGVGLCAGTDFSIPDAEVDLPRNLCPLIKSFYGFKAGMICPYFEVTDVIIGETTCDGKTKAYEVLGEKHPVKVLEIPHRKNEETFRLWRAELDGFIAYLEELTGNELTAEKLQAAVKLHNDKRRALQRLNELRWKRPVPISGKDALLINQIAFYDDPERFTASVTKLADEVEARAERGESPFDAEAVPLLTTGTPYAIPNWKLHHVVEGPDRVIVGEESCVGSRYYSELVDESPADLEGLLEAIARRYFNIHCACFTPNAERLDDIVELAGASGARGVINYSLSFCTPYLVEDKLVRDRLEREGIPLLSLESDYSMGDVEQLKTRIDAFVESL